MSTSPIASPTLQTSVCSDASAEKQDWDRSFRISLSHFKTGPWDYALLDNESEAQMEAGSFFSLSTNATDAIVGLGIGSSSTQVTLFSVLIGSHDLCLQPHLRAGLLLSTCLVCTQGYGRDAKGNICYTFDTALGAKPTAAEKRDGKASVDFQRQFYRLLKQLFRNPSQTTVVALNAIGYSVCSMTHSDRKWPGQAVFTARVQQGQSLSPAEFLQATEHFSKVSLVLIAP